MKLGVSQSVQKTATKIILVQGGTFKGGVGRECGAEAGAAAVWRSRWKWSHFSSIRLSSGSKNNPVLHRQRGGHPCRQQRQVLRRVFLPVHRQSDGHSSCSCETGTHGVQTAQQTVGIFVVDVPVIMQFEFKQSKCVRVECASDSVHRQSSGHSSCATEDVPTVRTVQKTIVIPQVPPFAVDVAVIMQRQVLRCLRFSHH